MLNLGELCYDWDVCLLFDLFRFSMAFTYYGIVLLTTEMLAIIKERSNDSSVVPCIGKYICKLTT